MVRGTLTRGGSVLATAEELLQLDPVRTYPKRAAESVVRLLEAIGFKLELNDEKGEFESSPPAMSSTHTTELPLRSGRCNIGTLWIYSDTEIDGERLEIAKWGARMIARGTSLAQRLAQQGVRHRGEDLQDTLRRAPLTPREREVVALLVSGSSTRDIASRSSLTVATVNTYLKRIFSKLGVHSRVELVAKMAGTDSYWPDREDDSAPDNYIYSAG